MENVYQVVVNHNGVWKYLDLGTDKIAWNVQVNNVAELKDRQASYSQAIKIPFTSNNCEIFEYSNLFDVVTDAPYKKYDCRIYCGGYTLAGEGSYLVLMRTNSCFECQILSGIAGLFDTLKNTATSELDLGKFQVTNAGLNPENWEETYLIGCCANYKKSSDKRATESGVSRYLPGLGAFYPVISIEKALERLFQSHGYTYSINENVFKDKYFSLGKVEKEATEEELSKWKLKAIKFFGTNYQWRIDDIDLGIADISDSTLIYYSQFSCDVRINIKASANGMDFTIYVNVDSDEEKFDIPAQSYREFDIIRNVPSNNSLIKIRTTSMNDASCEISIDSINNLKPSNIGTTLNLSEHTSFDTQLDFVKACAQSFGLTFNVDDIEKNVRMFTFKSLYTNIDEGNVKDWSQKVDRNRNSITSFALSGYAKNNTISLEENSEDEITDTASFPVKNDSLEPSKELFIIPFGSGQDIGISYNNTAASFAQIPLLTLAESDSDFGALGGASFNETKSHIVVVNRGLVHNVTPVKNLPSPPTYQYVSLTHYTAKDMLTNYDELTNKMLVNAKVIEDKFLLDPEDLEEFNPEIPVYIDKYGAYFYVNKIKNYQYGKLTTCELIKL